MKVMKFGGTSVGSAQRMKDVCRLITQDGTPNMIVLSAIVRYNEYVSRNIRLPL